MRHWIAKVDEDSIAQILGNMSVKTADDLSTGSLISAHHLAPFFGIKSLREGGGVDQITEHDGELPPFAFGSWSVRREAWSVGVLGGRGWGLGTGT